MSRACKGGALAAISNQAAQLSRDVSFMLGTMAPELIHQHRQAHTTACSQSDQGRSWEQPRVHYSRSAAGLVVQPAQATAAVGLERAQAQRLSQSLLVVR